MKLPTAASLAALALSAAMSLPLLVAAEPAPTVMTLSPAPACVAGYPYSITLAATGGTAPFTWSRSAGSLPAGLNLSSAGVLSGTPTATGTFNFTAQVTDAAGASGTKALAITVSATAPLAILYVNFPVGVVGNPFTQTLRAHGGTPPYTWSLASGTLPAGLTLSSSGALSGTPTTAGTSNFTLQVAAAVSPPKTKSFNVQILAPAVGTDGPWENLSDGSTGRTTFHISPAGEVIPAYLRKPAGNGPFPLVVMIHGGGTSEDGTYSLGRLMGSPTREFITAGFAIVSIDHSVVSGSTVSGNIVDDGEWGLVARAIETTQRLSFIDARRVAVVGQSHGGGVTIRAAGRLDILCAAPCAPAGIDMIAAWQWQQGGGAISSSMQNAVDQTAALHGVSMAALAASPSAYAYHDLTSDASYVRCPLFLTSGLNDTASPPTVMEDYGAALTAAGKYFESYYPANGPHGFVFSRPIIPETTEFATRAVVFISKYFSLADTDADGLPDGWELSRFNNLTQGPTGDPDGDGQNNLAEYLARTHPVLPPRASVTTSTTLGYSTSAVLPGGTTGAAYDRSIAVTGGTSPYTHAVTVGALPAGMTLSRTGLLGGTPTMAGTANFTVMVTDAAGATASRNFTLIVGAGTAVSDPANPGRLVNLSILTALTAGETMTMGTVIGGSGTSGAKPLLARAAGPSLTQFGVGAVLPDPKMSLVASAGGVVVATNNDWGTNASTLSAAFAQTGAFAYLSTASRDAAIFSPQLPAGNYTVQISDNATGAGTAIGELYDATPSGTFTAATPRLINVSVLKHLGSGLTVGFVVGGTGSKTLLIRAIGPTVGAAPFNVADVVTDPQLTLYSGQTIMGTNDNWGGTAALTAAFSQVGAFALPGASRDAALLATVPPGNYTVLVNGVGGQTGVALIEVYEVP